MAEPEEPIAKPAKASGRYRKVEVRTWGDEKFRNLSAIPPCGQGLWLFLMLGPHTGPIPGLFRAGRAAMAEELDWDLEAFDKAFGEAFDQGMVKADFKARVVWLPNAIKHNKPESPNVVRSWAAEFDLIPECALKREALDALKASIHALGEAYAKAFNEAFGKAYAKASGKAMPNQEQEQEQEQKDTYAPGKPGAAGPSPAIPPCPVDYLVEAYNTGLPELSAVKLVTERRKRAMKGFWRWVLTSTRADGVRRATTDAEAREWVRDYFARARDNDFLMGRGRRAPGHEGWRADFDFLLTEKGITHVIEKTGAAS